ncbi:hypothetical protein Tco_1162045 [Tanacetum coccineum]
MLMVCNQRTLFISADDIVAPMASTCATPSVPKRATTKSVIRHAAHLKEKIQSMFNGKHETDIREKDEKSSKNGQNRERNGKAWKRQSQIEAKVNKSQSQSQPPSKSTVKTDAENEEYLMGPPVPI